MPAKKKEILSNSLNDLTQNLAFGSKFTPTLSQTCTLTKNNRHYFLSNDRSTLSYAYITYGIIQTIIDLPVEDAFRSGIIIKSDELDSKDIQDLQNYLKENDVLEAVKTLGKWTRLYGGGAMVINTIGKSNEPLDINKINKNTPLEFYPVDLWELNMSNNQPQGEAKPYSNFGIENKIYFYGKELDNSRALIIKGKKAPSLLLPSLRGWGMSEVERLLRSFNQYLKNQDLIFELLDEAKIDVFRVEGFNSSLLTKDGTKQIEKQIRFSNTTKNYHEALVMDMQDEYQQKQINFAGLAEMSAEIRLGIANDLRMPLSKIFGQSATGFNSGEDDLENYNAMIESEIRGKYDIIIIQMLKIICQKLFGFVPDDLQIQYHPLRVLSAEQEQVVHTAKVNNLLALYDRGLLDSKSFVDEINQQNLLSIDLDSNLSVTVPNSNQESSSEAPIKNSIINKIFKNKWR